MENINEFNSQKNCNESLKYNIDRLIELGQKLNEENLQSLNYNLEKFVEEMEYELTSEGE
jgi:hypothetical protein